MNNMIALHNLHYKAPVNPMVVKNAKTPPVTGAAAPGPASSEFKQLLNTLKAKVDSSPETSTLTDDKKEKLKKELAEQCRNFESVFASYIMKATEGSDSVKGYLPKGHGEKIFSSMLNEQRADEVSKSGNLGLGNIIFNGLIKSIIKI